MKIEDWKRKELEKLYVNVFIIEEEVYVRKKGEIEETMPRYREGSFEPIVVPKRKILIDEEAEHVTLLYSKGNSIQDIKEILEEMYGTKMNEQFISEATKMVSEEVEEWKRRPLKEMYPTQTKSENQQIMYGYYTYDGYLLSYPTNNKTQTRNVNKGAGASTTGNIYGVYDMNGSRTETVMGVYGDNEGIYSGYNYSNHSGFNGRLINSSPVPVIKNSVEVPDSKYYDKYLTYDVKTACSGVCFGHALSETNGWYEDGTNMINYEDPWFSRGGSFGSSLSDGIFRYFNNNGDSTNDTTRIVGIKK